MLSPGMRQAAQISDTAANKISLQFQNMQNKGKQMGASLNELRSRLEAVNQVRANTTYTKEFEMATKAAKNLEREIDKLQKKESSSSSGGGGFFKTMFAMAGGNLISGAVMNSGEWIKAGMEKAEARHQAEAQLRNTMQSMGQGAGYEDAVKMSGDLSKNMMFGKTDIIGLQSQLRLVGKMGNDEIKRMITASADIAAKFPAMGLTGAGNALAKAVNDPEMMRRLGQTIRIDPAVQEHIQNLAKHGKEAQARLELLSVIENKVGGAAKAAFDANPMAQFQKTMGGIQTSIGEVAMALAGHLANAFNTVVGWLKNAWHWFTEHKIIMGIVAGVIGAVVVGLILYETWLGMVKVKTMAWTAVQWLLNSSMLANPITWIIIGIVALIAIIAGLVIAVKGWGTLWANVVKFATAVWHGYVDSFKLVWLEIQDIFLTGIELIQKGWYTLQSLWDKEGAKAGLAAINNEQGKRATEIAKQQGVLKKDLQDALKSGKDILTLKGLSIDTSAIAHTKDKFKNFLGLGGHEQTAGGGIVQPGGDGGGITGDNAGKINSGGQRVVTINIGKQIEKLEIHVIGGAKEVAQEIEDQVREVLRRVGYSMNGVVS